MKIVKSFSISIFLALGLLLNAGAARALDPATILVAENSVSNIIDDIKLAAGDIIDGVNNLIDSNSFSTSQRILLLMRELDIIAEKNIDKTFSQISEAERQIINDAILVINTVEDGLDDAFREANLILDQVNGTIGTLPFMDKTPRVERVNPEYFVYDDVASGVLARIETRGYFLDHEQPSLTMETSECVTGKFIRNGSSFSCQFPPETFDGETGFFSVNGQISYAEPRGLWERFKGIFSDNIQYKKYGVSLNFVPSFLGSYKIRATVAEQVRQNNARSQAFSDGNGHCAGSRNRDFNFAATAGWSIDTGSINPSCSASSKSACFGLKNVTSTGFQYAARITNNGDCGPKLPLGGGRAWRDGRGGVNGSVSWTEFKMVPGEVSVDVGEGEIFWGKDIAITLPEGTKHVVLSVSQIDGQEKVIEANILENWFSVSVDIANRSVVIKPKEVSEALAQ